MLRKLNCFFNIVIGSFIGVFIGFGIYKFWHFKTYPNLYVMQSAPWYTELLLDGAMVGTTGSLGQLEAQGIAEIRFVTNGAATACTTDSATFGFSAPWHTTMAPR